MTAGSHHEYGAAKHLTTLPSNRSFGAVFAVAFGALAVHQLLKGSSLWPASGVLAAVFAVGGASNAAWLTPLNRLWMKFGLLLGMVVAPVALSILFFAVVTPIGMLARALGKDFLRTRRDLGKNTYWIEREPPGPDPDSMKQQF